MIIPSFLIFSILVLGVKSVAVSTSAKYTSFSALGDSWASGAGPYKIDGSAGPDCARTMASYPFQLNQKFASKGSTFQFLACGGTNTTQIEEQTQSPDFGRPDFITIDGGGNDMGYVSQLVEDCILAAGLLNTTAYTALCNEFISQTSPSIESTIHTRLDNMIAAAKSVNPPVGKARHIVITGYATPYNINGNPKNCPTTFPDIPLGSGKMADKINQSVVGLNNIIKTAATNNAIAYADIDAAFQGHRLCDSGELYFQTDESVAGTALMHPTADGYMAMVSAVEKAMNW
ncbi:SGNH hydrolase [Rhizodiscina lignyota]|uniref:SGNH hydrolase n=1 Tax=Rhizodiscina lignyota TaxID=1504668 RepID=A0A9P4ILQ9_9PEZI|nr:SGNH hydrolase [Rhizodiscina lignyota]